jgi:hypothetical protein
MEMRANRRLGDRELADAKRNRVGGEASLACEGLLLTASEKALFDRFESERLPHDEVRRRILAFIREQQRARVAAAE